MKPSVREMEVHHLLMVSLVIIAALSSSLKANPIDDVSKQLHQAKTQKEFNEIISKIPFKDVIGNEGVQKTLEQYMNSNYVKVRHL